MDEAVGGSATVSLSVTTSQASVLLDSVTLDGKEQNANKNATKGSGDRAVLRHVTVGGGVIT